MKTNLPIGTWIKTRYRGDWEYGRVVVEGIEMGRPPNGTEVQRCVWKGDVLEPRGTPQRCKLPPPPPPNPLVEERMKWTMDQLLAEKNKVDSEMKRIIEKALEAQARGDMVTYMKHMESLEPLTQIEQANSIAAITLALLTLTE